MENPDLTGASLSAAAFDQTLPNLGRHIVSFGLVFFAFSTMIGWSYYGDRSVNYLFGSYGTQASQVYRWVYVILIPVGAWASLPLIWNLSDIGNGLMAFPNLIALIGLSGVAAKMLRDYEKRLPQMKPKFPHRILGFTWGAPSKDV